MKLTIEIILCAIFAVAAGLFLTSAYGKIEGVTIGLTVFVVTQMIVACKLWVHKFWHEW